MSEDQEKTFKKYVLFPIISGIVVLILWNVFPAMGQFLLPKFISFWIFLGSYMSLKIYQFALLSLFSIIGFLILGSQLIKLKRRRNEPEFLKFRGFIYRNVIWKWKYEVSSGDYKIDDLSGFCPQCFNRLLLKPDYQLLACNTLCICDHCNQLLETLDGSKTEALYHVRREIERQTATGEWKQSISK